VARFKHLSSLVRSRRSYARLSTNNETDACVVFVHGFIGDVVKTWGQFPDLCDSELPKDADRWARMDLYFYDYGAEKDFVKRSAEGLDKFLGSIFPRPDMTRFGLSEPDRSAIRDPWLPYNRLILVGHSLGAVVIRECLENRLRPSSLETPAWTSACELHLFAAAHSGFKFSGWKGLVYRLGPRYITSIPTIMRAFDDLQEKSGTLTDLGRRTQDLALKHPQVAALLIYGSEEDVVIPAEFDCDPAPMTWVDKYDHVGICKPDKGFTDPLDFVTRHELRKNAGT